MYSTRITRSFQQYCDTYQPGHIPQANNPQPQNPDDENSLAWADQARELTRALTKRIGFYSVTRFWETYNNNCTLKTQTAYAQRFTALLDEHGDFDKALAAWKEEING